MNFQFYSDENGNWVRDEYKQIVCEKTTDTTLDTLIMGYGCEEFNVSVWKMIDRVSNTLLCITFSVRTEPDIDFSVFDLIRSKVCQFMLSLLKPIAGYQSVWYEDYDEDNGDTNVRFFNNSVLFLSMFYIEKLGVVSDNLFQINVNILHEPFSGANKPTLEASTGDTYQFTAHTMTPETIRVNSELQLYPIEVAIDKVFNVINQALTPPHVKEGDESGN